VNVWRRQLLLSLSIERHRKLLPTSEDPLRFSLQAVRKLGLDGVVGKRSVLSTNAESDQARGSSAVRTESRSSLLAVTFPMRTGSMRCSWAFPEPNSSSLSRRWRTALCRVFGTKFFPALKELRAAHCSFTNLPEKKASRWGRVTNCGENEAMPPDQTEAGLQVAFVKRTAAEHLRHCSFIAMRDDKKPAEVVRETWAHDNAPEIL
jgi:hypothetical protein